MDNSLTLLTKTDLWNSRCVIPTSATKPKPKVDPYNVRISLLISHPNENEVCVTEMCYGIHAYGPTREEALAAFWQQFAKTEAEIASALARVERFEREETPDVIKARRQLAYLVNVREWEERLQAAKRERDQVQEVQEVNIV